MLWLDQRPIPQIHRMFSNQLLNLGLELLHQIVIPTLLTHQLTNYAILLSITIVVFTQFATIESLSSSMATETRSPEIATSLLDKDAFQNEHSQKLFEAIDELRTCGASRDIELPEVCEPCLVIWHKCC